MTRLRVVEAAIRINPKDKFRSRVGETPDGGAPTAEIPGEKLERLCGFGP